MNDSTREEMVTALAILRENYNAALKREEKLKALLRYMTDIFRKQADYIERQLKEL